MNKYLVAASLVLQNYFTYRFNLIFWRIQIFTTFLIFYFLWFSVAEGKQTLGAYTVPQIYSYFIIGYIIRTFVFSTKTADLGGEIQSGDLSNRLLKPLGVINYFFVVDLVDKFFNLLLFTFEFGLILLAFRPPLVIPSISNLVFFIVSLIIAACIFFFYSLVISFLTFWVDSAWSTRFLFGVVFVNLLSGQFLPLDFLPATLTTILNFTPFPYLYYYPVRFWLGMADLKTSGLILVVSLVYLLLLGLLSRLVWRTGIKSYQSYGR